MGISHFHLTLTEAWLMPLGFLLDLVECWKHETGRAHPYRRVFIDDVIPAGI